MSSIRLRWRRGAALVGFGLAAALWIGSCRDYGPDVVGMRPDPSELLPITSDPTAPAARVSLARSAAPSDAGGSVTYVSLRPGAVPNGSMAEIRNERTGATMQAVLSDGGFDPVAVPAEAGDTLTVKVVVSGGGSPVTMLMRVPAVRRPIVVRTDPPPRRRDVPLNARIVVVFSEPMDSVSLGEGVQLVSNSGAVPGTISPDYPSNTAFVFEPAAPLAPNTQYRLVISDRVRDLDGDPLEGSEIIDFTMATATTMSRIAFVAPGAAGETILSMNADGSDLRVVAGDVGNWGTHDPAWSPDGSRLAFVTGRHRVLGDPSDPAIYVMNADGTGIRRLTYQGSAATPSWSPDGRRIAFSTGSLYVMNADGSNATRVVNVVGNDRWVEPAWSPDGTRIAFIRAGDTSNELWITNADGSGLRRMAGDHSDAWSPAWSPDGTRIAFAANGDIYVIGADGSGETRLTYLPGQNGSPSWSPDGTMLVFASSRAANSTYYGGSQIYVMDADGSRVTELTSTSVAAVNPDWSRSGSMPVSPPGALWIEMAPTASGDNQTDTVRATLSKPLRVRVLRRGAPAEGVTVTWSVGAGRGSVSAATTTTDAEGIASVSRTLGDTAPSYPAFAKFSWTIARVEGATGSPVVFTATALPGHPARLTTYPGDTAGIGAVNSSLGVVRALAEDSYGNSVTGVAIQWSVTAGGGSITPVGPDTTGNEGNGGSAWARWTLGPEEGEHIATATAPLIPGAPVVTYHRTAVSALVHVGNVDDDWNYTVDFSPDSVAVRTGQTVGFLWSHLDAYANVHNVTFDDDPTEPTSSRTMGSSCPGGEIFTRRFSGVPRTIHYQCTVHGERGTVTVLP